MSHELLDSSQNSLFRITDQNLESAQNVATLPEEDLVNDINPENPSFIPSLNMRPHHFKRIEILSAFLGKGGTRSLARTTARTLKRNINDPDYVKDVVGKKEFYKNKKFEESYKDYLTDIKQLPDDSFVHLNMQPDGLCNSCAIGAHCTATNMRMEGIVRDTLLSENQAVENILADLAVEGFCEGEDYITSPTTHIFYDWEKQKLNSHLEFKPVTFEFNSVIVRTSALRKVAEKYYMIMTGNISNITKSN